MRARYHHTWQGVVRSKKWPESWQHWLVNMIETFWVLPFR
jgi:hypothetical protein